MYTFAPFIGGSVGIFRSKSWGFLKTNIGKAVFFISVGLFLWGSGNLVWAYYNFFLNTSIPYPSLADLFYFPGYFLWFIAIIYLARATGMKFSLIQSKNRFYLFIVPFFIMTFSYYFLLVVIKRNFSSTEFLKTVLDLYYPSIDIINLTVASIILILSVNFFGGKYKFSLFCILSGFISMYIADFTLAYTTSVNTYYNASVSDLFFTFATFLLTWGTLSFYLTPKRKNTNA